MVCVPASGVRRDDAHDFGVICPRSNLLYAFMAQSLDVLTSLLLSSLLYSYILCTLSIYRCVSGPPVRLFCSRFSSVTNYLVVDHVLTHLLVSSRLVRLSFLYIAVTSSSVIFQEIHVCPLTVIFTPPVWGKCSVACWSPVMPLYR